MEDNASETSPLIPSYSQLTEKDNTPTVENTDGRNNDSNLQDIEINSKATPAKRSLLSLPRSTKIVLFFFSTVNLLASITFSLIGPFFPQAAGEKGVSLTQSGLVFAVYQLVLFLASPIIGNFLGRLGPKRTFIWGVVIGGVCTALFGTLIYLPDGTIFFVMCMVCRSILALGSACFINASFAIVSTECSSVLTQAFAVLETATGIGYMLGPSLGGLLYSAGGFGLPFYVFGSLLLVNGIIVFSFLPALTPRENVKKDSILHFFKSPLIIVGALNIFIGQLSISCYESTFSTRLQDFNLSTSTVSLIFAVAPCSYGIFGPLLGYLVDTKQVQRPLTVFGGIFFGLSFLLVGHSIITYYIPDKLWIVIIGCFIIGLGYGAVYVPSVQIMIDGAVELGYPSNMDTYAMVGGMYNSVNSLGGFVGPLVGSALVDKWGFSIGYTVFGSLMIFVALVSLLYFMYRYLKNNRILKQQTMKECEREVAYKRRRVARRSSMRVSDSVSYEQHSYKG